MFEDRENGAGISKQQYLKTMLAAFQQFEYTRSPQVLKSYMKKNQEHLARLVNMISQQDRSKSPALMASEVGPEKEMNQQLERKYAEELEIAKGNNLKVSQMREHSKQTQMDSTLFSLNKQIERLSRENQEMCAKIEKKKFFREWKVMNKELEGAKSLNVRLEAELEKKKKQIKSLIK